MLPRTVRLHVFIVIYLGIQLLVPIRGLVLDKRATRGDFSWNMYADNYACSILYSRRDAEGRTLPVDHRRYFRNTTSMMKVFHRDVLPAFHAQLCDDLDSSHVEALVSCSINGGPWIDLVRPGVHICAAPGYGVE